MRSLTLKLTLAFLLVGLIGAILVAVLVGQSTRTGFNRFLSERDQAVLTTTLSEYYVTNGSWAGISAKLENTAPLNSYSRDVALTDANGTVVVGKGNYTVGQRLPARALNGGTPISANGQTIGYMFFLAPHEPPPSGPGRPSPDVAFLQQVTSASAISAAVAALIALILGVLLARTLTHPLRELTAATQAMASGQLDQRVTVRSHDEIGELARSFNQMSADLARASQLRKQMTADLAHDLRTPLSILRGYTEGLQDGRLQGAPSLYTIMHGEVEHLQRLVEELRVLSLADAGELPLNRRAVDPAALLERTGLAYIVQAEQNGIALRVEAPEELPSISVDTDRMAQVLNNLVSNAFRYTAQGEIALVASASQQQVYLQVRDTGTGIEPADLPFVFDRFYRADKARQRMDSNASGLGLAIAKAIVEAHGGTLTVASQANVGTTFTITLPAAASYKEGETHERGEHAQVAVGARQS
jgi:two-component system sensor histidine kinase BaeS